MSHLSDHSGLAGAAASAIGAGCCFFGLYFFSAFSFLPEALAFLSFFSYL
jgi:hypothetical protein